jgi:hypothetical protein
MTIEYENSRYVLLQAINKLPISPSERIRLLTDLLADLVAQGLHVPYLWVIDRLRASWNLRPEDTHGQGRRVVSRFMADLPEKPNEAAYQLTSMLTHVFNQVRRQYGGTVVSSRVRELLEHVADRLDSPAPTPAGYPELLKGFSELLGAIPLKEQRAVLENFHLELSGTLNGLFSKRELLEHVKKTIHGMGIQLLTMDDLGNLADSPELDELAQRLHEETCEACRDRRERKEKTAKDLAN